jgi:hypothetical protein
MDDNFRIALGMEIVSIAFQLGLELRKIVDFTVKNDPDGLCRIRHGLVPALKIDNGQSSKSQPNWPINVESFVIRPAVHETRSHPLQSAAVYRSLVFEVVLSADAAHKSRYSCRPV